MQPIKKAWAVSYAQETWRHGEASTEMVTSHAPTFRGAEVLVFPRCWIPAFKSYSSPSVPSNSQIWLQMEAATA